LPPLDKQSSSPSYKDDGLADALEQILKMEDVAQLNKPQQEKIKEYLRSGEHVYQLFSILIHSGGAAGGHYYAYIKSFQDGKWYNFNDSNVSEIDDDMISAEL